MESRLERLRRLRDDKEDALLLIMERKALFVSAVNIPLQLLSDERRIRQEIAEIDGMIEREEQRIAREEEQIVAPPSLAVQIAPGITMDFVLVPAGPFLMGSTDANAKYTDEKPQHTLTLPAYHIGKTPVTNAQFRPFVEGDGYTNRAYWTQDGWHWRERANRTQPAYWYAPEWNGDDQPVVGITWYEAMAYARWLSVRTGKDYRLPTEAQWEKAARGTDGRIYPWGNQPIDETRANYNQIVGHTTPVGSYPAGASPYGALDMVGNVWEWTRSQYRSYPYNPGDGREDIGNAAKKILTLRGGSWSNHPSVARCAYRNHVGPRYHYDSCGVRLARLSSP